MDENMDGNEEDVEGGWLDDIAIGDVLAGSLGEADDLDDVAAAHAVVARNGVGSGDLGQLRNLHVAVGAGGEPKMGSDGSEDQKKMEREREGGTNYRWRTCSFWASERTMCWGTR